MASKSVGVKGRGDKGLAKPEPKTNHKKTTAVAEQHDPKKAALAKKAGRVSDAQKIKPPKRRAGMSAEGADDGSEIGRRVGHSPGNLKRVQAKEINPRKASKKPGAPHGDKPSPKGKHTARRNAKLNDAGMTAMLEDSATGKPSRKSTRKSTNRVKENQLTKRQQRRVHSPEARAARGA